MKNVDDSFNVSIETQQADHEQNTMIEENIISPSRLNKYMFTQLIIENTCLHRLISTWKNTNSLPYSLIEGNWEVTSKERKSHSFHLHCSQPIHLRTHKIQMRNTQPNLSQFLYVSFIPQIPPFPKTMYPWNIFFPCYFILSCASNAFSP